MLRGLFTNKSVNNLLAPGIAPGDTVHAPSGEITVWRAAHEAEGEPEANYT